MLYEKKIDGYLFSNDKTKLQVDVIHNYLSNESYWAKNIPIDIGFERYSSQPALIMLCLSPCMAKAVTAIIGMAENSSFILSCSIRSMPEIFGS